ncbi:MAG: alpha/beta fold hydrolase [Acidimicrobiia bacterium]|nr:alpha/beta fold hydrolase [Acidimicrobiia bacterium]
MGTNTNRVDSSGVSIAYAVHGPDDGRPVLLLHGFPDTGRLWRHQVGALVDAGHRVIVPDQRGFGASDKPADVDAYNLLVLAGDALAVLDDAGVERAAVVGHDWGAPVAWALGAMAAPRVERLVAMSVGHPTSFRGAGFAQKEKSWYLLLFQFPGVAERWLSDDGWSRFREWSSHPDADAVIADIEANGSLTPGLNWYRANGAPESMLEDPPQLPPIEAPVMAMWSTGDMALTEEQMTGSEAYCAGGFRYERIEGAGHWIQLEQPEVVNGLLVDFLR